RVRGSRDKALADLRGQTGENRPLVDFDVSGLASGALAEARWHFRRGSKLVVGKRELT
ncbi:hypothetical protein SAMN02745244_01765, partial [Tessaracoccus bendigoensis DSM 12906]